MLKLHYLKQKQCLIPQIYSNGHSKETPHFHICREGPNTLNISNIKMQVEPLILMDSNFEFCENSVVFIKSLVKAHDQNNFTV